MDSGYEQYTCGNPEGRRWASRKNVSLGIMCVQHFEYLSRLWLSVRNILNIKESQNYGIGVKLEIHEQTKRE